MMNAGEKAAMDSESKTLFIGYGNPGRLDDGLGPAMAEAVEKLNLPGVVTDSDYQLTVEDAAEVAKYDLVIFCRRGCFRARAVLGKADIGKKAAI